MHTAHREPAFQHEALFYSGEEEFVERTSSFIREGVEAGEPVLVVVSSRKIGLLRSALDRDAARVRFADMADVGVNPARIIPAWREFVDAHLAEDQPVRGIGEPIWPERSPPELVECQRHESLLNLAFAESPAWRLLCPYDTDALEPAVVDEAMRSHPVLVEGDAQQTSPKYRGLGSISVPFSEPLPDPAGDTQELDLRTTSLDAVRELVFRRADQAELGISRTADLVLAVHELAANSLRYGGSHGTLRIWEEDGALVCEVRDAGRIENPLAGRELPPESEPGGRGLWLVNQLCDLAQIRTFPSGSAVRLYMRLPPAQAA